MVTLGADRLETLKSEGNCIRQPAKATDPDHLTDNLGTSARSPATTGCHGNVMPLLAAEMFIMVVRISGPALKLPYAISL